MHHDFFMRRCLELAERGRGHTGVNPLVGAVLVRDGHIMAEGWHEGFGKPHAERQLLKNYEQKISSNDILFVNLEPCCHTNKKTPPCTDLIIERGIRHVVIGMMDPNPAVSGKGIAALREAGIRVDGPVLRAQCEWLNRGFSSIMKQGRPWITLKKAQGRAGEIARPDGSPLKITSEEQDHWSHQFLRATHDAILVGVETIVRDDPQLNTRFDQNVPHPLRIILDPHLRIPLDARVVSDDWPDRTLIITSPAHMGPKAEQLLERGVRVFWIPVCNDLFDWNDLFTKLINPEQAFHGIASILVEGGKKTWAAFSASRCADAEVRLVGN